MKAILNGTVLAESEETVVVEGNHYFPPASVDFGHLERSAMRSPCPWKGIAGYYHVEVDGERDANAAWTYRHPFPWIRKIRGHVAFWGGVEVGPS
ncbi:MAG: DUF427 domain-containing protein [Solirubrobacterales bacterium]|nr:DUF427 domain-containing protein [Solirubrobacterales bacterium]